MVDMVEYVKASKLLLHKKPNSTYKDASLADTAVYGHLKKKFYKNKL